MASKTSTMTCIAILDNNAQKENLCQCIRILGGEPMVNHDVVTTNAPYPSDLASHLMLLYEQYWRHEIVVSKD